MFTGYIVDNLRSPGTEETLPKFRRNFGELKKKLLHLPFIGGD